MQPLAQPYHFDPPTTHEPVRAVRRVYFFEQGAADGGSADRALLGGKGADLAEMCRLGLPVPPGFTITTESCADYLEVGQRLPVGLEEEVRTMVQRLERATGKRFGAGPTPLLLSVRSGAAVSMPGMMDTVLNLGLGDETVAALAATPGLERFAYDAYRRLIDMFGNVVMGVPHAEFEHAFDVIKERYRAATDRDVPAAGLAALCEAYKEIYRRHVGCDFPMDPQEQLLRAIEGVFRSWNKPSAQSYRRIHSIQDLRGTAVNVQAMVFGNLGPDSATGVGFTRNPSTGDDRLYGEFLVDAQGEDVVAGIRTPQPISELASWNASIARELEIMRMDLERHFGDMQDFEFTIERGKLWMLQTRRGKRSGAAAVRIAVDMVRERLIDESVAVGRVAPSDIEQLLLPSFDAAAKENAEVLAKGLAASPGAASGKLSFDAGDATQRAKAGERVLLVRRETSADDVEGMHHAAGILTATGGMTSHAAVVARGWGKCCVAGVAGLFVDEAREIVSIGDRTFGRDDVLSIDGSTGEVMLGEVATRPPAGVSPEVATLLGWADARARLGVRANADTPEDARHARDLGAQGVGLCRTEHMFFRDERLHSMRRMILAETPEQRRKALNELLPHQRRDFVGIFEAMAGRLVTIRLLDPPLHEFLPVDRAEIEALAADLGMSREHVEHRVDALREANPMLGHRGCRIAVTYPEILDMQVTAIVEAAIECRRNQIDARPEIMIPLVGTRRELAVLRERAQRVIETVMQKATAFPLPIGTMIEVPRAALVAGDIACEAEFFSFGTNDLTQMTFGYSRDDAGAFLPQYLEQGILARDPFVSIDVDGVGKLVRMAIELGRAARPSLEVGVCGEHGGDPDSIRFFDEAGLDYVSCSPLRVPVARLIAGQAGLSRLTANPGDEKTMRRPPRGPETPR